MNINPSFKLREPNATESTSILMKLYFKKKRLTYSLGKQSRIIPELWDHEAERTVISPLIKDRSKKTVYKRIIDRYQRINPNIKTELENIDTIIDTLITDVRSYFGNTAKERKQPSVDELKQFLEDIHKPEQKNQEKASKKPLQLNEYIDLFIREIKSGKRLHKDAKRYSPGTIKNYDGFKTQFDAFQKKIKKKLRFEDITIDFYHRYVQFFNDKNYSPNTIGRHIKNLKVIMRAALDGGLHSNTEFERKKFRTIQVEVPSVYLTEDELNKIYHHDLSQSEELEKIRDVFLIGCYTALRYSDYSRISKEHIKQRAEVLFIEITTQKTKEKVIIPVRPELHAILKKYNYTLPKTYEQKVNKYIKEIAAELNINEPIEISQVRGGLTKVKTIPKHNLIKTHTARRTGATLMYLAGMNPIDIMKITGHKTEANLLRYIKVTKEETAVRMMDNAFFRGNQQLRKV